MCHGLKNYLLVFSCKCKVGFLHYWNPILPLKKQVEK